MIGTLLAIDALDSFREVKTYPASTIGADLIEAVRQLDEREELEPFLRSILTDVGDTPHGPAEVVDILTHKLIYRGAPVLTAFILKGRSFPKIRPKDVAHQIYRLEKIVGMEATLSIWSVFIRSSVLMASESASPPSLRG
ncbi:MAG: hypothetical protein HY682_02160 [Chloroflexi bacterium]|nr:hypothetical protein [Chloroflexota bacterium]